MQARTLEFYQQVGLAEAIVERGHKVPALNLWVKRVRAARVPLQDMGQGLTAFSYPIIFPRDEHERLLIVVSLCVSVWDVPFCSAIHPAVASATNQSRNICTSRCGRCGRSGVTTK